MATVISKKCKTPMTMRLNLKSCNKVLWYLESAAEPEINGVTATGMPTAQRLNQWVSKAAVAILMLSSMVAGIMAQTSQPSPVCSYTLTDGSQLVDDCPVCDHLPVVKPMRGTFQLRLTQQSPLFSTYSLENLSFTAGDTNGKQYKVVGNGVYRIGGEVGLQQNLFLEVSVDDGVTNKLCYFTNAVGNVTRLWPMLQIGVDQTNGTATQQFHLEIDAAPFLEIWFSTSQGFKADIWDSPTNLVSAGDLISSVGRVVKRNHELTQNLAPMPSIPDLWLKDVDVLPGGEIAFSIEASVWSETLNTQLDPGDLLSDRGRILHTNQQLIAAFLPKPPLPNGAGLGAVQVMDNGEVDFSVQTNFFSTKLGLMIEPEDLLSDTGGIVRTGADLVRQFSPANSTNNCGLNAIYIWPIGEIWFSTQGGFYDTSSNYYAPGDLLSDQGYVVYRNWELLSAFQPAGSPADFGLDALFVVTDVTPASPATALGLPQLTNQPPASLVFQRIGGCRVFQLEKAASVTGPFMPVSSITTDTLFLDVGALTNQVQGFYRLHQW